MTYRAIIQHFIFRQTHLNEFCAKSNSFGCFIKRCTVPIDRSSGGCVYKYLFSTDRPNTNYPSKVTGNNLPIPCKSLGSREFDLRAFDGLLHYDTILNLYFYVDSSELRSHVTRMIKCFTRT